MRTAQRLYEGIDIGEGQVGLISYMRTDSVTLSNEAIEEIREFIGEKFGENNLPESPRELGHFTFMGMTAGITEEIVMRGFLIAYVSSITREQPFLPNTQL